MIHFEYDGASLMLFKVFDAEGRCLECCPRGSSRDIIVAGARPAVRFPNGSSGSSGNAWESSDSPELFVTPETSDDNYMPPSSRRARSKAAASGVAAADMDGIGTGLPWPTVDDGVSHGGTCS